MNQILLLLLPNQPKAESNNWASILGFCYCQYNICARSCWSYIKKVLISTH